MKKGDMFTVYLDGNMMTVCVLGFYNEEYTGEQMVILAIVNQDNMVHVPLDDLNGLFRPQKFLN